MLYIYIYLCIYSTIYIYGGGLVVKLCPTLEAPWTVTHQAPLSMEFPRKEYWSGLPFLSLGDLPDPEIKPGSLALQVVSCIAGGFFINWATREAPYTYIYIYSVYSMLQSMGSQRVRHDLVTEQQQNKKYMLIAQTILREKKTKQEE